MKYFKIGIYMAMLGVLTYSCSKSFLDKKPLGQLDPTTLANFNGVNKLLIGAYSMLDGFGGQNSSWASAGSNWVYGSMAGGEAYKGSSLGDQPDAVPISTFTPTATNGYFQTKWQTVYDGVSRTNDVLRSIALATDIAASDVAELTAEARGLRAWYHFEAKKMWNNVPYVDETITYGAGNYFLDNKTDIWPKIEEDLQFAIANLPNTQTQVGRLNKYSAEAILARAFMFEHKYTDALTLLNDIIGSGNYGLVQYHQNFDIINKNSKESIFAAQCSVNDGSSGSNGNWGDVLNFPYNGGPGTCCGFFQPSQFLVNHYLTDAVTGLPNLNYDFSAANKANWVKSDQGLLSTDPFTPEARTLDPRLDWTVGRRGIPYLDWGLHPGNNWIRAQSDGGPYTPLKNVYSKNVEGKLTDKSFWTSGVTANNINLIRYADVLLMAAEAETEVGSLAKATGYVNQLRTRAADPTSWVMNGAVPAANYKIGTYAATFADQATARKAIQWERMLELGMEGHRFFDLVRWGNAQTEMAKFFGADGTILSYLAGAVFTPGKSEYWPIPQNEIDKSGGKMVQNPGY